MKDTVIDTFLAYGLGITVWFFGGLDEPFKILLGFAVIDYFSGVSAAVAEGQLNSHTGFKGIIKKCVMFALVGAANLAGGLIGGSDAVRTVVILFYIGNEGLSIMENAFRLGVPFPEVLKSRFEQFRDENKGQKGGDEDVCSSERNIGNGTGISV
mgnify:CR=1 FL=1